MHSVTNYLIGATSKASKFLKRDFYELAPLQFSGKKNLEFCKKSFDRTKEFLKEELGKRYKCLLFSDEPFKIPEQTDLAILIEPVDSIENLSRSIPFFAISITYLEISQGKATPKFHIMNFPALDLIYHAEKGDGAWIKNMSNDMESRVRASKIDDLDQAVFITDDTEFSLKITTNLRMFASPCYSLAFFISGKADLLRLSRLNYSLKAGFDMCVRESGGMIVETEEGITACSISILDQFRHRIEKNF